MVIIAIGDVKSHEVGTVLQIVQALRVRGIPVESAPVEPASPKLLPAAVAGLQVEKCGVSTATDAKEREGGAGCPQIDADLRRLGEGEGAGEGEGGRRAEVRGPGDGAERAEARKGMGIIARGRKARRPRNGNDLPVFLPFQLRLFRASASSASSAISICRGLAFAGLER